MIPQKFQMPKTEDLLLFQMMAQMNIRLLNLKVSQHSLLKELR